MKRSVSHLLSLLRASGMTRRAKLSKQHNDIRKDNSCETSQMEEKPLEKPEPEEMARKGKQAKEDYRETFLVQCRSINHKQTSVLFEKDVYDSVRKILRISGNLTIAGFVNNVLRHHFREHKEDISELRRDFITDLSKEEEEGL